MTFLFDIGNVLLNLHFDRFHNTILGDPSADLPEELLALKDPYETGAISCQEFVTHSLKILQSDLSPAAFTTAWQEIFSLNSQMWEVVHQLKKQGHQLILFSNTNALHAKYFLATFPDFALFDHHHFSQEAGAIKPHFPFYQDAVERYHLNPSETLYLDDLPENIAMGKQFNFRSWQYDLNDHQACLDWLAKEGIQLS